MHLKVMEITLLIMENHGKIIELCFRISVGTLITGPPWPFCFNRLRFRLLEGYLTMVM